MCGLWVKICGVTSDEALTAAVDAGADALGFVFAASPRQIAPAEARSLCAGLPEAIRRVAVMLHPTRDEWRRVWREFRPDWLQTDADDYAGLELDPDCGRLPVYRDTGVAAIEEMQEVPDRLLYEGPESGRGSRPDWSRAARLAGRTRLVLAGGLDAANVGQAVRQVRPWGVDVSSGVESGRGRKDPAKIAAFVRAARLAEASS